MPLTVLIDMPTFEKGQEIAINGLGLFVNGEARELTVDDEERFYSEHGVIVRDALINDDYTVSGSASFKPPEEYKEQKEAEEAQAKKDAEEAAKAAAAAEKDKDGEN